MREPATPESSKAESSVPEAQAPGPATDEGTATTGERRFDAVVHVMLRRAILDPQGRAVRATLARLGHDNVESLRVGKRIEVRLRGERQDVEAQLERIAGTVLSNPVLEEVRTELHEVPPDAD